MIPIAIIYYSVIGEIVDIGCYMDRSDRDLDYVLYEEQWATNSGSPKYEGFAVNRCVGACAAMGYMYAGKFVGYFKTFKCKKTHVFQRFPFPS